MAVGLHDNKAWDELVKVRTSVVKHAIEGRMLTIVYIAPRIARTLLEYVRSGRAVVIICRWGGWNVSHRASRSASCTSYYLLRG